MSRPLPLAASPVVDEIDPTIAPSNLLSPYHVTHKYPNLPFVGKIGTLAVKLARKTYFGADMMAMCTIQGSKGLVGTPSKGYWWDQPHEKAPDDYFGVSNVEFAALWKI